MDISTDPLSIDYESLGTTASLKAHLLAGALAGITEHSLTYPLDVIKTRMQSMDPTTSTNLSTILRQINAEGRRKFFRGIVTIFLGAGPAHAFYFATYELFKKQLVRQGSPYQHVGAAISGAFATIAADAFMNPFDGSAYFW